MHKIKKTTKQVIVSSIKIITAAVLAIFIASLLKLQFAVSAGIVAILSVQPSKRETIHTALSRLYGFITSLIIGILCFNLFGFSITSFYIYLVIYIFVCQCLKWYSSMAMNSVLISHFISLGNSSLTSITNELLIFIIGVGLGILVNLHLHKNTYEVERLKAVMDDKIVYALRRMAQRLIDKELEGYNGSCFIKLDKSLNEAKNIAKENYENQLRNFIDEDENYIKMREEQIHILKEMYKRCKNLKTSPITAKKISRFIFKIANEYDKKNDCKSLLNEFYLIWEDMKKAPLPLTREEFEDRAELFTLLEYIEEFLNIKKNHLCTIG